MRNLQVILFIQKCSLTSQSGNRQNNTIRKNPYQRHSLLINWLRAGGLQRGERFAGYAVPPLRFFGYFFAL